MTESGVSVSEVSRIAGFDEGQIRDVVVVGGGPAGSTISALLAEEGWDVLLVEKAVHPRFHIGESLLPNNLPIFERLGVGQAVQDIGVRKPGAEFVGASGQQHRFPFAWALGRSPGHAFQVRRSELDERLFRNAGDKGAELWENCEVIAHTQQGELHRVQVRTQSGEGAVQARFVVDATGRDGFLARSRKWRSRDPRHASAAVFGHFKNVPRREGQDAGYISVYWFEHGWAWMIPLRDGVMSVGAVCRPEYLKSRDCPPEAFLRKTLAKVDDAGARMANAVAVAPVHVTGNYSYASKEIGGSGFLLIGDAYAFVDPVFSSGVYLAMNSAVKALPVVRAGLRGRRFAERLLRSRYRFTVRRKLRSFSWFIYRFTTPALRDLFDEPRNDLQVAQAVVSMLAGDGNGSFAIRMRLRLFKAIYYGYALARLTDMRRSKQDHERNMEVEFVDETICVDAPRDDTSRISAVSGG